jgi:pimeloyl-ACP methyl ester carboxylesterase
MSVPGQTIRFCSSADGARIAYATVGQGPPLVKAANWLNHLEFDWDSPVWRHWLRELGRDHTLVRYDERGCGLSDWSAGEMSVDAWIRDLEAVVDALELERFPLLGISQGAPIAIAYAVRHPERVSRLVLVGAYAAGRLVRAETPEARAEALLDLEVGRVAWRHEDDSFRQVFASQFLPGGTREQWDAFNRLQRTTTSTDNVVRFLDVFARIDVRDLLPQVRCPTLVAHARDDLRVPASQARELATQIPEGRLLLLGSRNHVLTSDEPAWRVFLAEAQRFLAC